MHENRPSSANPQATLVMKFGGTSVGSIKAMQQVLQIVQDHRASWPRTVVVVSALAGVTNLLLDSANRATRGDLQTCQTAAVKLRSLHYKILDALVANLALREQVKQEIVQLIADFLSLCQAFSVLGETTPRGLDAIASLGERMCVRILAPGLESAGVPACWVEATQLIVTDETFQSAHPDLEMTTRRTRQALLPLLERGQIPVVTGFLAATPAGVTTTLGRGGSDYSAAILGAALSADEVWIWTDVDGVMTADPRIVPDAVTIPELTYHEISELAYYGAKVLHPMTIRPVIEFGHRLARVQHLQPPESRDAPGGR